MAQEEINTAGGVTGRCKSPSLHGAGDQGERRRPRHR